MKLPIIKTENSNLPEFICYWKELYNDRLESLYTDRISKSIFIEDDLLNLFIWKNGMKLSSKNKSLLK